MKKKVLVLLLGLALFALGITLNTYTDKSNALITKNVDALALEVDLDCYWACCSTGDAEDNSCYWCDSCLPPIGMVPCGPGSSCSL